ncbi:hypothetical protein REPUB_Repub17cG0038500 [Reevesia pubescens]
MAALKAVNMAIVLGAKRVVLEGDALGIIHHIQAQEPDLSAIGSIIEEIKLKLKSFQSSRCVYIGREANEAAHVLYLCVI